MRIRTAGRPSQMKVCVTGATGFVGAHVVRSLTERGDDVRVVYRNPDRLDALRGLDYSRAKADVLDYRAMRRAPRGVDVLFHLAGVVGPRPGARGGRRNAQGAAAAVEGARAGG